MISEETSKRITSLRFLLAILVVFIHNNFKPEKILESASVSGAATLFCPNSFTEWIQYFISYGLGSCVNSIHSEPLARYFKAIVTEK